MAELIKVGQQNAVAVLTLDNGSANVLSAKLRAALIDRITACEADAAVKAIVLSAAGPGFSAGLDFAELENPPDAPTLTDLCRTVEECGKPVVAALHGRVLGGAVELALAAHARVAQRDSLYGFPECFTLAMMPSAGATQRLPRLIGAGPALTLIRSGRLLRADAEMLSGLFDRIVADNAEAEAIALAQDLADHPERLCRTCDRFDGFADPAAFQAAVSKARHDLADQTRPADQRLIDSVEASLILPFEAGLAFEEAAAEDCRDSAYSKGMRHAHRALHRASNLPERLQANARGIATLGVVGGGPSGAGIAALAAAARRKVILYERSAETAAEARSRIEAVLRGIRLADPVEAILDRYVVVTEDLTRLGVADLVIEAVAENPRTKAQVFAALDKVAREDAILASNSALLSVGDIAAAMRHPGRVIGLHFHAPVPLLQLAEVIPGPENDAETIVTAADFVAALGRTVVRCGTGGGTLGEAMLCALRSAAWFNAGRGASPFEIDAALAEFGLQGGVFMALDRIGIDVALKRMDLLHDHGQYPAGIREPLQRLVDVGRTGLRAGRGFYRWDEHMHPEQDDDLAAVLGLDGMGRRGPTRAQVQLNCLAAMANQGAKLLRSGAALRPSDIDVVMILGHGFPRYQGGPMKAADMAGLFPILQELRRCGDADPVLFDPEPGIAALVRNGEDFEVLNRVGRNRRTIPG
ncbi:MAG: 3-hydroxyacyl-CoA dehydrogenase NAD-binding domain-containing protein [Thalassovita sp.]|nr:3-hydroxyacyl-CoA dehydrogenase NAD-binding domain-containing protein [Thalassovita sp.]